MKGKIEVAIVSLIVGAIIGLFLVFDAGLLTGLALLFGVLGACLYFTPMKQTAWVWWMAVPPLIGLYIGAML